ncbi:alpha/beta fold hydrolase [Streptomyces sp. NPDC004539]|uniref:thioesterase II family protein n=1 Tax=Streptomyces sp. NPDC004539 TaxID=3154280 RepID=UPI0033B40FBD
MPLTTAALWLRRYHPAPDAAVRLLWLPHAGAGAAYYAPMARELAPDVDVLAVQYPGRQDRYREPPLDDLRTTAAWVVEAVLALDDRRPLALFGHSMGAWVGYEAALLLERAGTPPLGLFASGRRAPTVPHEGAHLHDQSDRALLADVRRISGTDARLFDDEDLARLVLPALRADYKAMETYEPRPAERLSCPLTVLTGEDDPLTAPAATAPWSDRTTGPTARHTFPGGHFYLKDRQREFLDVLRGELLAIAGPAQDSILPHHEK